METGTIFIHFQYFSIDHTWYHLGAHVQTQPALRRGNAARCRIGRDRKRNGQIYDRRMIGMWTLKSKDWFKGKSTPETMDFLIKYGAFLEFVPLKCLKPIHWLRPFFITTAGHSHLNINLKHFFSETRGPVELQAPSKSVLPVIPSLPSPQKSHLQSDLGIGFPADPHGFSAASQPWLEILWRPWLLQIRGGSNFVSAWDLFRCHAKALLVDDVWPSWR